MTYYPNSSRRTLSDSHRRMLYDESGISQEVAAERGYFTARSRSEVPEAFIKDYQRKPGLVAPMFSPDGVTRSFQLRPHKPRKDKRGKPIKYETPDGVSPIVDVHPRMLEEARNGTGPLLITEGAKTGDAATSRGVPTVVLAGVWMWCVPKEKPFRLKPCFDHIRLEGREVLVAFDSDCMTKENVQRALSELVAALEARGADVKVIYLTDAPDGSKQGIDDYLAAGGTVREMFALARKFDPADVGRIRLSRDERLRAGVEDLGRRWWGEEWKGRGGHTDRDVALKLVEAASRNGKIHPDGIRVEASWGALQVGAKVARKTLAKALARLEERDFLYRDNAGRKADKTGAFVLRAKVDQYGRGDTQATTKLRVCDLGGLPLRAPSEVPRLRWPRPKSTPRRGTVRGTRKVRGSTPVAARERVERLGKIRGAVVDALYTAGGSCTIEELCEVLHRSRPRDLRRRVLPMLEELGIIEAANDVITLAADWSVRLEAAREVGGELEADELAEERRRRNSLAYHRRHRVEPDRHHANAGADGHIEDLRPAVQGEEPVAEEAPVSPLAVAFRGYLERQPADACQPPGWIASTLWAYELYPVRPSPAEASAALEELGGERYRRGLLERARSVA